MPVPVLGALAEAVPPVTLLTTALRLGIRHSIDWDHIAAITDITSTSAAADAAETGHQAEHQAGARGHAQGGEGELRAHGPEDRPQVAEARARLATEQRRAIGLGSLYARGHAMVVAILGLLALSLGALLPDWIDPVMSRVVGLTLVVLGVWVFVSLYEFLRFGREFRLRSRWMLVFDGLRLLRRRLQARFHGHEHVRPLEMSSYGPRTAFGVGMIHGMGPRPAPRS
jgi:hypothetical protein